MADDKKNEKDFGEGIEVVNDSKHEEKDTEINFGKALSFFKKGTEKSKSSGEEKSEDKHHKTELAAHQQPTAEKEQAAAGGDEIDLGKLASGIKRLFGSKKGPVEIREQAGEESAKSPEDEISLNPKSLIDFFSKRGAMILFIIAILFSMGLTAHVRLQLADLPFTEEWASSTVYNLVQNDVQSAVNAQYPRLPEDRKSQILAAELDKARSGTEYIFKTGQYAGQKIDIQSQIDSTTNIIKDFYKNEKGQPYSPDIDPYYWNRYAKNIVETGRIGDEVRDGVQFDTYQLAPEGRPIAAQDTFFPYFLAYLYKIASTFNHSLTLWTVQTLFYPALVTALTALLVFLIGRRIAGNIAGFFGSLMAGLHVAYVNRTIHGDNDAIVILFAVLTL
ncbi:MAG TPA: STT3 domain-containing protein, partial [Candidatus Nanoarchaeia archaeon]|nr:STT3 domain-containing protein [Candidatus Nanoarchaeia archaeon]